MAEEEVEGVEGVQQPRPRPIAVATGVASLLRRRGNRYMCVCMWCSEDQEDMFLFV